MRERQVVRRHAQRVVDVEDDGVARAQRLETRHAQARIEARRRRARDSAMTCASTSTWPGVERWDSPARSSKARTSLHARAARIAVDPAAKEVVEDGRDARVVAGREGRVDVGRAAPRGSRGAPTTRWRRTCDARVAARRGWRWRACWTTRSRPAGARVALARRYDGLDAAPPALRRALVLRVRRRQHADLEVERRRGHRADRAVEAVLRRTPRRAWPCPPSSRPSARRDVLRARAPASIERRRACILFHSIW